MTSSEILKQLKRYSNKKNIEGMARFGIQGKKMIGGPAIPVLRRMAKDIKKTESDTHGIAQDLWSSGYHEARILASMIDDPKLVTSVQMEDWVKDFDSWDVCDQVCMNLFDKTKFTIDKINKWSKCKEEFVKRASFALMAALAFHSKDMSDNVFIGFLPIIKREATDESNYVRKAVNWALRQIGKRNNNLKKEALKTANDILILNNKTARWIAMDAKRELLSK
jgi:3-methyladenine DNA glycosylase AlkD